jgi:hypothetical protein
VGLVGVITAGAGGLAAADEASTALVERAPCAAPTPLPPVTDARTDGATTVRFRVASVVHLRVSDARPVAASTNTGCAPRSTDAFVVGDRAATDAEAAAAVGAFRSGDWRTPGTWHDADG